MLRVSRNYLYLFWTLLVILVVGWLAFSFASPLAVTFPRRTEYAVRMQVVIEGVPVDFSQQAYQTKLDETVCGELSTRPVAFHGGQEQWLHVYWRDLSGSTILRNYGYKNYAPFENYLGVRADQFPQFTPVSIHGNILPETSPAAQLYVYTGDQFGYTRRDESLFLEQPLEDFLDDVIPGTPMNALQIQGNAQEEALGPSQQRDLQADEAERARPLDVLGNVVIFIQTQEPTEAAIIERFLTLTSREPTTCESAN